jgi:dephospho-CoA kinase
MTRILGITGGIAAGKSSVAAIFAELGAVVVNADQLARAAVAPGSPVLAELVRLFSPAILGSTGELDRAALARLVFADPAARARLNAVTHPAIAELAVERLQQLRASGVALVVYEAALLFEAGAAGRVDWVLTVAIDPALQRARLAERDGLAEPAVQARIDSQWPLAEKVAHADFVIDNSGPLAETRRQVMALHHYLLTKI